MVGAEDLMFVYRTAVTWLQIIVAPLDCGLSAARPSYLLRQVRFSVKSPDLKIFKEAKQVEFLLAWRPPIPNPCLS